jgi:hypothetical protein
MCDFNYVAEEAIFHELTKNFVFERDFTFFRNMRRYHFERWKYFHKLPLYQFDKLNAEMDYHFQQFLRFDNFIAYYVEHAKIDDCL